MLGVLVALSLAGLVVSSNRRLGFSNPFQLYFLVWFSVFFTYWFSRDTYIDIPDEALGLMILAKGVSLAILLSIQAQSPRLDRPPPGSPVKDVNIKLSWAVLLVVVVGAPFAYQRALQLSGSDIFTVIGYMRLRSALTADGDGYGLLAYLTVPSFVISSVCVTRFVIHRKGFLLMVSAISISLFYTYLSTGRTFVLLLLIMIFAPLVVLRRVQKRGVIAAFLLAVALFVFLAGMTSKGVSIEDDVVENIDSVLEGLRAYTVAPLLAFSRLLFDQPVTDWGANTFRIVYAVLYRFGLSEDPPIALVREYMYVPDPTNVYTVYDVYLADFSYLGMLIPSLFLLAHWAIYRRAVERGGLMIFYCACSFYPLSMQFFQDQYVSILSQWIQIVFWYWLLVAARLPHWLLRQKFPGTASP